MSRQREIRFKNLCDAARSLEAAVAQGSTSLAAAEFAALKAQLAAQRLTTRVDPLLVETVADFTDDPAEAIQLYKEAISLSDAASCPTYTQRIWMAARLLELGNRVEARRQLIRAKPEAERLEHASAVSYSESLLQQLPV